MDRQRAAAAGTGPTDPPPRVTRDIAAEAAVWVARLHGPRRTRAMERECLAWQARSNAHRHAFERCTETWMDVPSVTVAAAYAASAGPAERAVARQVGGGGRGATSDPGRRLLPGLSVGLSLAFMALATAAVLAWQPWRDIDSYRTGVGELQTVVLADGTRLSLNTDTRVQVELGKARRSVSVGQGEVLFDVARDAQRPFVVRAGGSEVVAVGTVFLVRLTAQGPGVSEALAVTLIEGQVSLRPASGGVAGDVSGGMADGAAADVAPAQALQLKPGERVRLVKVPGSAAPATQQVDRPRLEQVIAWTRSEALFENVSLAEAVAEMNRYSRTPIVLMDDLAGDAWRVSGQYRAADNAGFARAVAALHGLVLRESKGRLELARAP